MGNFLRQAKRRDPGGAVESPAPDLLGNIKTDKSLNDLSEGWGCPSPVSYSQPRASITSIQKVWPDGDGWREGHVLLHGPRLQEKGLFIIFFNF